MSANLSQIYAARPLLGAQTAKDDVFYVDDVSATGIAKDKGIARNELARAMAEAFRLCASKFVVPYLNNVTGLTGGGPNNLDGILNGVLLAEVQTPCCVDLVINDQSGRFMLRPANGDVADGVSFIALTESNFAGYLFVRV